MFIYGRKTVTTTRFGHVHREIAKKAAVAKVRCSMSEGKGVVESVRVALEENDFHLIKEITSFINIGDLSDEEIVTIMRDARKILHSLTLDFYGLVNALLSVKWKNRSLDAIQAYSEFTVDILVARNAYITVGIPNLILNWIPRYKESGDWTNGSPSKRVHTDLRTVHGLLNRILAAVPMSFDVVIDTITAKFPYFKKPPHFTICYIYNVLWLMKSEPLYEELLLQLVINKLLILDVNAPREKIEELREEVDEDEPEEIFQMDDVNTSPKQAQPLDHPIGHTLDICLLQLFKFLDDKFRPLLNSDDDQRVSKNRFFKILIQIFDDIILPSHDPHHVQFVIFHVCSIRPAYEKSFLSFLWLKVQNPNGFPVMRHVAVCYIASYLARAKFVPLSTITYYLQKLSNWANTYINDSDEFGGKSCSLKANMVFFSVCQALFYLIAFRARDLTRNAKILKLLSSLQLTRLAMCHFNPLRYCLPTVAIAFAGVARAHQLAYCHTVLERNARRKMSTFDGDEELKPDERLDTFFPFDPYILPISGEYIEPNYLVYKVHDLNETAEFLATNTMRQKRGHGEMDEEDDDNDFIPVEKLQKLSELSNSERFEKQYYYGTSPGFNQY
ncbi:hypothetical protein ACLKA7_011590 [Drosophila subpalustris]